MKRAILTLFVIAAGALAGALIEGWHLQADAAGTKDEKWNVVTLELGPGAVDSRSVRPGTGLLYVLDGGGLLELDGKASIALHPGVAAALNPEKAHVLKNTSKTETLRVLILVPTENATRGVKTPSKHSRSEGLVF